MTTENMSEKDALWLYATEPGRLKYKETENICGGILSPKGFLEDWRSGNIILAPDPDEPAKPVRVPISGKDIGWLFFNLPANHKQFKHELLRIEAAPTYGGVYVCHLPDERETITPYAPIWIKNGETYNQGGRERQLLWPEEIEFSPEFLKGETA